MRRVLLLDGKRHEVDVRVAGATFAVTEDAATIEGTRRWDGPRLALEIDGRRAVAHVTRGADGRLELWLDSKRHLVDEDRHGARGASNGGGGAGDDVLVAPMPAKVVRVAVAAGDTVEEGQTLVVLESMKMELGVTAPRAGRVAKVGAVAGVIVPAGTMLVELEPTAAATEAGA